MMRQIALTIALLCAVSLAHANGRQPCDRGAGGISRCEGTKFRCNDGRISRSKKTCDPAMHGPAPAATGKKPRKESRKQPAGV